MRRGFTLLELLIYISLAGLTITVISAFLLTLNRTSQSNSTTARVEDDAARIRSILETALKDAQSVKTPSADGSASELQLVSAANNEVTYTRRNDNLYKEPASGKTERFNKDNVLITNFSTYHIDPQSDKEGDASVRFEFTAEYDTPSGAPQAKEYQHTKTIEHTVNLGNRPLSNVPDPDTDPLKFWLRADRGVVTDQNDKVARWYDQSTNEYNASQPDSTQRPSAFLSDAKNGYPAVDFSVSDGTENYLAIRDWVYNTANTIDGITIFAVAKSSEDTNQTILSFDRSEYFRFSIDDDLDTPNGGVEFHTSGSTPKQDLGTETIYTDGTFYLMDTIFNKTQNPDKRIFVNGNEKASAYQHTGTALGTGNTRYGFVGQGSEATSFNGTGGGGEPFKGQIAELLVYDTALSETKQQEVRKYLNEKYDLYQTLD